MADALTEAADALDEVFAAYMQGKLDFPAPSKARRGEYIVAPPAETMAKAALYVAMKEARITNVQLAKRLGVDEKEVRRLFDPHYASKLPRIAQAVALLGKRLVIGLEAA
ncbi:MAG: type II toxin-antitoxin system HicB family antitoxin [Gammaproteobacteria bacterium]|nr:type II toxin-antitoxin system HicB family antitoxin [Gammaproteobacteria bacterium]